MKILLVIGFLKNINDDDNIISVFQILDPFLNYLWCGKTFHHFQRKLRCHLRALLPEELKAIDVRNLYRSGLYRSVVVDLAQSDFERARWKKCNYQLKKTEISFLGSSVLKPDPTD